MRRAAYCVTVLTLLTTPMQAQSVADSAATLLRPNGNGIEALRAPITRSFDGPTAADALTAIAKEAGLSITFDAQLKGLQTNLTIVGHRRSAATALLEVASAGHLRIRVLNDGQLIVDAADARTQRAIANALTRAVSLPAIRATAERDEQIEFRTEAHLGGVSLLGSELRASPTFVEPDLLRSIQALPGIEARSDYSAGFNARGGEADQNLILIDGYPIYSPFHLGGLFSTFIDPTVGRVSLFTGGLPLRYGGRLSSVLDVKSAEPVSPKLSGRVEVSLVSSLASIGRTFGKDGSWMVGARRTYADVIANLMHPDAFPYHFTDAQAHLATSVGHGVRLSVTGYKGVDESIGSAGASMAGSWGNTVLGTTLSKTIDEAHLGRWRVGDSVTLAQRLSYTGFDARLAFSAFGTRVNNRVSDVRVAGSATSFHGTTTRTIGYELAAQRLTYAGNAASTNLGDLFPVDSLTQRPRSASVFGQQTWRPWPSFLVEGGARIDALAPRHWVGVSPRLTLKYFWRPNFAFSLGTGSYAQWIQSLGHEEEPFQLMQFWVASDQSLPVSRARDLVAGLEQWITPSRLLHVSAYYKRYDHVLITDRGSAPDVRGDEFYASGGSSYGAEVLLRQLEGGTFTGWLAYNYAVNTRKTATGASYWPTQDRRHSLNLVGSWLRGRWNLGARANFATGMPTTPMTGAYVRKRYDPTTHHFYPDNDDQFINGPLNGGRLPWYLRVDVSARREILIGRALVSPYLSVVNLFNAKNVAAYLYSYDQTPMRGSFPNLPLVPTVGFSIAY